MRKQLLSDGLVLAIVAAMVGAAELTGQSEIIFPEVTAIAVGAFLAPRLTWRTDRVRMLVTVTLCAVLGVLLVRFVPLPVWGRLTLAYGLAQVVFLLSGTRFAPMISAIALPVLLGTESWVRRSSWRWRWCCSGRPGNPMRRGKRESETPPGAQASGGVFCSRYSAMSSMRQCRMLQSWSMV